MHGWQHETLKSMIVERLNYFSRNEFELVIGLCLIFMSGLTRSIEWFSSSSSFACHKGVTSTGLREYLSNVMELPTEKELLEWGKTMVPNSSGESVIDAEDLLFWYTLSNPDLAQNVDGMLYYPAQNAHSDVLLPLVTRGDKTKVISLATKVLTTQSLDKYRAEFCNNVAQTLPEYMYQQSIPTSFTTLQAPPQKVPPSWTKFISRFKFTCLAIEYHSTQFGIETVESYHQNIIAIPKQEGREIFCYSNEFNFSDFFPEDVDWEIEKSLALHFPPTSRPPPREQALLDISTILTWSKNKIEKQKVGHLQTLCSDLEIDTHGNKKALVARLWQHSNEAKARAAKSEAISLNPEPTPKARKAKSEAISSNPEPTPKARKAKSSNPEPTPKARKAKSETISLNPEPTPKARSTLGKRDQRCQSDARSSNHKKTKKN
jgi:hypothetical protein